MSPNGQAAAAVAVIATHADDDVVDSGAILVWSADLGRHRTIPRHEHDIHQLAWASKGILSIGVDDRLWILSRSRALWIPAGTQHDVAASADGNMVSLYFDPVTCPMELSEPAVIDTTGLLGSLIEHLASELAPDERRRAEAVVFDVLEPLPTTTLHVPRPTDQRAVAIWDALRSDPADERTLSEFGADVGASSRTLARILADEVGIGFAAWRTRIRIGAALPLLAAGQPVSVVAPSVGYATASAFVAAFRRTTGTTPGKHFA